MNLETLSRLSITKVDHWVVWGQESSRGAKPAKVPYQVGTRKKASVTDKGTWTSWARARDAYLAGGWAGLGFVLTADLGLVFLDLDGAVDHGVISPWAKGLLMKFDSYSEYSFSGTGIHILCRGHLPPQGRRKGHLEMYNTARMVCLTGDLVDNTRSGIRDCSAAVTWLHKLTFGEPDQARGVSTGLAQPGLSASDEEVLSKARSARNSAKFVALYDKGDTTDYGGDDSGADLGLCSILSYWCGGDRGQVDRLFRRSALYREKWERTNYREPTLTRATGRGAA